MGVKRKKLANRKVEGGDSTAAPESSRAKWFWSILDRHRIAILVALLALGSARIVLTYNVFSHTADEPAHIACGMEWLDKGVYQWEAQHPPLSRIASAIGPFVLGVRSQDTRRGYPESMWVEGTSILYKNNQYDRNLAAARLGILPFFWIAALVVYFWGRRYFDSRIALLAVFFFSFLPTLLAHSSLATTDAALTAFLGLTFLRGAIWVEEPTWKNGVWLGGAGGLAILSKFSSLLFFPAGAALALGYWGVAWGRKFNWLPEIRRRLPSLALAVVVTFLVVWAAYRFSFGRVDGIPFPVPAPEVFKGIQEVQVHNTRGHTGYLLGQNRDTGWWYFFEVALLVKSPLAFILLLALGCFMAFTHEGRFRNAWLPLCFSAGILIVSAFSQINIGLRHVLPVYIGFSILAALALDWLLRAPASWTRGAAGVLVVWFAASSLLAHPDYLAYFNELAGAHPENILVDSDLDWGQDIKRLSKRLKEVGAKEVAFTSLIIADYERQHGFPRVNHMKVDQPLPGWNAAGLTNVKQRFGMYYQRPDMRLWIDSVPPKERVGKSILLWYFDYPKTPPAPPPAGESK